MAVRNGLGFPAILVSKTNAKLYDQKVLSCVRLSFMSLQYICMKSSVYFRKFLFFRYDFHETLARATACKHQRVLIEDRVKCLMLKMFTAHLYSANTSPPHSPPPPLPPSSPPLLPHPPPPPHGPIQQRLLPCK